MLYCFSVITTSYNFVINDELAIFIRKYITLRYNMTT